MCDDVLTANHPVMVYCMTYVLFNSCNMMVESDGVMSVAAVRVNRSTSTDGLTSSDHIEPCVSHTDVVSSTAAHYSVTSSKPVRTVAVLLHITVVNRCVLLPSFFISQLMIVMASAKC